MTKVFFKTYGCTLNCSDTELMQGILADQGFTIVPEPDEAEAIVINSCTVKQPTENRFFKYLAEIKKLRKPIVIAGCIPKATPTKVKGYAILGPDQITKIKDVIEEALHDNPVRELSAEKQQRLNLPKVRRNPIVEIIPICSGCLGSCTYCIVKFARGRLHSYDKTAIIKQAESAITEGVKEIWLTAQDTGCYGRDIGTFLPSLLRVLVAVGGDFHVRLGMMNPNQVQDMIDDLIEVYKSDKIYKFLHIPVQSGNNEILQKMNRRYTVEQFKEIISRFRQNIPDITIATDIICGFPGETKEQFKDSIDLINEIRPDVLNISRFWSRPKTKAEKMEQLSGEETKKRSRTMTSVFNWISFENNKKWRDWEGPILIDEKGKEDSWIGRNFAYKPVILEGNYRLGKEINVRVFDVTNHDLRAREQ